MSRSVYPACVYDNYMCSRFTGARIYKTVIQNQDVLSLVTAKFLYTTCNPPLIYFVMSYRSTFIIRYHSFTHRKIYLYTHSLKFTALHLHTSDTDPPLSHFTKNFGTILCYLMLHRLKCLSSTGKPHRENVIFKLYFC